MRVIAIGVIGLLILTGLLAPLPTSAQRPEKIPRIGVMAFGGVGSPACNRTDPLWEAFQQGLRDLGYVDGQNMRIEYRCRAFEGAFEHEQLLAMAAELVRLPVDVLVTAGPGAVAAKQATMTIPIVFAVVADPLSERLVASLARPGGNVTGQSVMGTDLAAKRMQILAEMVPGLRRLAVLWNPARPSFASQVQEIYTASASRGLSLDVLEVRSPPEFDHAFRTMGDTGVGAAILLDDAMFHQERTRLTTLAAQRQIPAIYGHRDYAEVGGLLSYGPHFPTLFRRAAIFVDKILKGAKPEDLPVEQPTKFELVLNLNTAQALGLTVPPLLLAQADEVIE
jgi:putative tryptophan/tyrosine transport system substrate-binding protein